MSEIKPSSRISRRRRLVFGLITILVSGGLALAGVELALRFQRHRIVHSDRLDDGMIVYDQYLGWRLKSNSSATHRHYDFDVRYTINRHGFRGEFAESDKVRRFAVVGDSFTFGIGVDDDQTFVHRLNQDPTIGGEFLNFSVPAYSTDQEYLLIRDRVRRYEPDVVVLIVYLANDLLDNELGFPLQANNAKPYFELADGQLKRRNLPVPRQQKPAAASSANLAAILLGDDAEQSSSLLSNLELVRRTGLIQDRREFSDQFFQQRLDSALQLFSALVDAIAAVTDEERAELKLVLMPGSSFLDEAPSVSKQYQDFLRRRITSEFADHSSVELIDLAAEMRAADRAVNQVWYFPHEGHLTPAGHRAVADLLADQLGDDQGPTKP